MNVLIWDFDGTLARRRGAWTGALLQVLERQGISCDRDRLRPWILSGFPWHMPEQVRPIGESADCWWERLEPIFARAFEQAAGLPADAARRLATEVRAAYLASEHWELFDDTQEVLSALSDRGWTHFLLTNHVPELPAILSHLGIASLLGRVFNSAETGVEKPHAAAFQNVLAHLPEERTVWMIGDNISADVRGAEAHGIPAILVRSQHADARHSCNDLRELLTLFACKLDRK